MSLPRSVVHLSLVLSGASLTNGLQVPFQHGVVPSFVVNVIKLDHGRL